MLVLQTGVVVLCVKYIKNVRVWGTVSIDYVCYAVPPIG